MKLITRPFVISLIFILSVQLCNAQNEVDNVQKEERPSKDIKVKKFNSERSMLLKTTKIVDKFSDIVTVDKTEYRWFDSKKNAITYFVKMSIKHDLITVYLDSDEQLTGNNLITIRNETELIESKFK